MKIQPVRGTHDLYNQNLMKYNHVLKIVNRLAKVYCFDEIITPIFETTELFRKPLGKFSDVVLKEKDIVSKVVQEHMENIHPTKVPLTVDVGFGQNWLEAH